MEYDHFKQFWYFQVITSPEETKEIVAWISDNESNAHVILAAKGPLVGKVGMTVYIKDDQQAQGFKMRWQPDTHDV